ncbi:MULTISPECIES: hypothetical protein [unclassified Microbacterium]|uniref:DUF7882 family protein n=1 Tax=unclassified Microbacterium TaxID=2609290 RepID=UPI003864CB33
MGHLTIGTTSVVYDDRTLEHLEAAFTTKLRRRESFVFSWSTHHSLGGGRVSVWLHPAVNLEYRYSLPRDGGLNLAWVDALIVDANSLGGMRVVPEPGVRAA